MERAFRASELILRYLQDTLSKEEIVELENWVAENEENRTLFTEMTNPASLKVSLDEFYETKAAADKGNKRRNLPIPAGKRIFIWRIALAAAIIATIGIALYWLWRVLTGS